MSRARPKLQEENLEKLRIVELGRGAGFAIRGGAYAQKSGAIYPSPPQGGPVETEKSEEPSMVETARKGSFASRKQVAGGRSFVGKRPWENLHLATENEGHRRFYLPESVLPPPSWKPWPNKSGKKRVHHSVPD